MIEIQLTQGQIALVDDIDADLAEMNWQAQWDKKLQGYYATMRGRTAMHRVILSRMLGRTLLRAEHVDHIRHNTLDNRRSELRLANGSQNQANSTIRSDNTSGYKGVSFITQRNKFKSAIHYMGNDLYLGMFYTAEEAARAYDKKAKELFGEFALTNFNE